MGARQGITIKQWIYTAYLKEYIRLAKVGIENIDAWTLPIAAARLREKLPGEEKWLLGIIDKSVAQIRNRITF